MEILSDHFIKGTKKPALRQVFLKISRKCFLVSTAEDLNSSQIQLNQRHEKRNAEYLSSSTVTCANSLKSTIKKHPTYAKSSAFLQQNYCVRSCSVISFLLLSAPFVTAKKHKLMRTCKIETRTKDPRIKSGDF